MGKAPTSKTVKKLQREGGGQKLVRAARISSRRRERINFQHNGKTYSVAPLTVSIQENDSKQTK